MKAAALGSLHGSPAADFSRDLQSKVGREIDLLVDAIDEENDEAIARSPWDAPEIDGNVFLTGETDLKPGDMVRVRIVEAEEYDLVGEEGVTMNPGLEAAIAPGVIDRATAERLTPYLAAKWRSRRRYHGP